MNLKHHTACPYCKGDTVRHVEGRLGRVVRGPTVAPDVVRVLWVPQAPTVDLHDVEPVNVRKLSKVA